MLHRLGLSETILVFRSHVVFLGGLEKALERLRRAESWIRGTQRSSRGRDSRGRPPRSQEQRRRRDSTRPYRAQEAQRTRRGVAPRKFRDKGCCERRQALTCW
ncbi:MAG TPA: hypothetical protein EYP33_05100 [Pyrodictium sp.]|nr:hypothetical protein [Pyrodictium sp.]